MPEPLPISRRETLKRAAGALALGLGAPAALAATGDDDEGAYRLAFYKRGAERPFHTLRLSDRDARAFSSVKEEALGYIKFDGVDGEAQRTEAAFYGKHCCP